MVDFILELERVLRLWPDNVKWNLIQISEQCHTKVHLALDLVSDALNKALDVHEPLSFNEASKAYAILLDKNRGELERRRQRELEAVQKALETYDATMENVRLQQATKNWRSAYRTLSYYYGNNKNLLPDNIIVAIADDCLRLGIRGEVSLQEMTQWMELGIQTLLSSPNPERIEDALDFIDAYGDYFLTHANSRGGQFLTNLFLTLKPSAMEFNLTPKLNDIAYELNLNNVIDVIS